MLDRHEQQVLFDAAFDAFWRDPKLLEQLMYLLLPKISGRGDKHSRRRAPTGWPRRCAPPRARDRRTRPTRRAKEELQFETSFTFSDRERLQQADFESMSTAEFELAKKLAEQLPLPVAAGAPAPARRPPRAGHGRRLDLRATMQRMARQPQTLHAGLHARARGNAARSSCCSTSRARWNATRGCCCTTCTA